MREVKSVEQLLPVLRALISEELIAKHGYKKRNAAQLLGVTPSAVTQYTKHRRGRSMDSLVSRMEIRLLVADLASRIAREGSDNPETTLNRIVEVAYQTLAILKGSVRKEELHVPSGKDSRTIEILRLRLQTELREAQRSLQMANSLNDDFAKMLFREIATDSMRHADIVSHLIGGLDSIRSFRVEPSMMSYMRQMIIEEEQAAEQSLSNVVRVKHPAIRALLKSVDVDEQKHRRMLRELASTVGVR